MKRHRLLDRVRDALRKWLVPREDVSTIVMTVELDGSDRVIQQLEEIELRLERVAQKAESAMGALDRLK